MMNIKIQGGGAGKYANTGSSFGVAQYLNHENKERLEDKKPLEEFYGHNSEKVDYRTMINQIDQNKGKLGNKEAKFYVLTISPSQDEIKKMGSTEQERSASMKAYTRKVMDDYAHNFDKKNKLSADDLVYFAKVHHGRGDKEGEQMHAHVIVSRMTNNPDRNKKARLSSLTTYKERKGKINGFDRTKFYQTCEDSFDQKFDYKREFKDSFAYQNTLKNGSVEDIRKVIKQADLTPFKEVENKQQSDIKIIKPDIQDRINKLNLEVVKLDKQETRNQSQDNKINLEQTKIEVKQESKSKQNLTYKQQFSRAIYQSDNEKFKQLYEGHRKELDKSHSQLIKEMKERNMPVSKEIEKSVENQLQQQNTQRKGIGR